MFDNFDIIFDISDLDSFVDKYGKYYHDNVYTFREECLLYLEDVDVGNVIYYHDSHCLCGYSKECDCDCLEECRSIYNYGIRKRKLERIL